MEISVTAISIAINLAAVFYVYKQVAVSSATSRASLLNDLIGITHFDHGAQNVIYAIYKKELRFIEKGERGEDCTFSGCEGEIIDEDVDALLSRFQMVCIALNNKAIKMSDLRGLRYEIISTGRDKAIRDYLKYLNTKYQDLSGIVHDHYKMFKQLYLEMEYDQNEITDFQSCVFKFPKGMTENKPNLLKRNAKGFYRRFCS